MLYSTLSTRSTNGITILPTKKPVLIPSLSRDSVYLELVLGTLRVPNDSNGPVTQPFTDPLARLDQI
jgi:hypothetical protein